MLHLPWQTIVLPIKWLGVLNLSYFIKGKIGEVPGTGVPVCILSAREPSWEGNDLVFSVSSLFPQGDTQTGTPYHPRCPLGQSNQMPQEHSPFRALRLGPYPEILKSSIFKGGQHHSCSWTASTQAECEAQSCMFPEHVQALQLTSKFLLPVHFIKEVLGAQEEVIDLAALLIPLRGIIYSQFWFLRQEFTDAGHREDNLFHRSVQSDDLSVKINGG